MIHVDKYEKYYLIVMAVVVGAFFASVLAASLVFGLNPTTTTAFVNPQRLNETMFAQPGVRHMGGNVYDAVVVARMWMFSTGSSERNAQGHEVLRFPLGADVTFYMTSPDVQHGILIENYNLNLQVIPGQVARQRVVFNRPGTFHAICHEFCGRGHQQMYFSIIVEDPAQAAS